MRYLDARAHFIYYATGITPAVALQVVALGPQYAAATDSESKPLDRGKTYKIHLSPNIRAKDFWSFIVYDNQSRSMLQTDQQFPSIGSQKKGIVVNADTSVDVWFGPVAPKGHEANWVQTVPDKGWNVLLRLYGRLKSWFDKTWKPGEFDQHEATFTDPHTHICRCTFLLRLMFAGPPFLERRAFRLVEPVLTRAESPA